MKGVMIHANSGGYYTLALIGFPQVSLQYLHQLIGTHHCVCYQQLVARIHQLVPILFFAFLRLIRV
jgi:hypothetical protein